jgi:hypothetical protein
VALLQADAEFSAEVGVGAQLRRNGSSAGDDSADALRLSNVCAKLDGHVVGIMQQEFVVPTKETHGHFCRRFVQQAVRPALKKGGRGGGAPAGAEKGADGFYNFSATSASVQEQRGEAVADAQKRGGGVLSESDVEKLRRRGSEQRRKRQLALEAEERRKAQAEVAEAEKVPSQFLKDAVAANSRNAGG